MKLAHKLAIAAILLTGAVPALAGEPIDGVDVKLGKSIHGAVSGTATTTGSAPGGTVAPGPRPAAISDQAAGGVLTRNATTGAIINWGDGMPNKAADKKTTLPSKSSQGTPVVYGQPVTFTAGVNRANNTADIGAKKPEAPPAAPAPAKISDNESPLPADRRTRK